MNPALALSAGAWVILLCAYILIASLTVELKKPTPAWAVPGWLLMWATGLACVAALVFFLAYPILYLLGAVG